MAIVNMLPQVNGKGLELLYNNSSETVQNGAFTLSLDLSKYTHVLISTGDNGAQQIAKTHNKKSYTMVEMGTTEHLIWFGGSFTDSNFGQIGTREVTATTSGLNFTAKAGYGNASLVYKVYGTKIKA